jgi:hypothetical protein
MSLTRAMSTDSLHGDDSVAAAAAVPRPVTGHSSSAFGSAFNAPLPPLPTTTALPSRFGLSVNVMSGGAAHFGGFPAPSPLALGSLFPITPMAPAPMHAMAMATATAAPPAYAYAHAPLPLSHSSVAAAGPTTGPSTTSSTAALGAGAMDIAMDADDLGFGAGIGLSGPSGMALSALTESDLALFNGAVGGGNSVAAAGLANGDCAFGAPFAMAL